MKSEITTWLIFYLILATYAFSSKLTANEMARKVMAAKQWPPPDVFSGPNRGSLLDSLRQPLYGTDAIKTAKRYVIMSDVFLWCVVWSFIIFGLFLWES
jgi:hypothetical protein